MAQAIINKLNGYTIQDARVDEIQTILNRTAGQQGIEIRDNHLMLSHGGYYEDGVAIEDTSGATANNSAPGETTFDIIFTVQDEVGNLTNGIDVSMFLGFSVEDENGESDSVTLDLSGTFVELISGSGEFFFVSNGGSVEYSDNYIRSIKLAEDRDWEITITFAKSLASVQIDEIDVYTINTSPVNWPADLVYSENLMDMIVAYLINNGYVSNSNAM